MKERAFLPSCAFKVNGQWLEDLVTGYHTLNAKGWELIEKDLTLRDNDATDGSILTRSRYPQREIEIEYVLKGENFAQMRSRFLQLMRRLNTEQAQIIFNGEPDKYVIGTFVADTSTDHYTTGNTGTFKIICPDPCKYSVEEFSVPADNGAWSLDYDGTYVAHPTFEITFPKTTDSSGDNTETSQCGYVGLANQTGAVLQFGDEEEKDYGDITIPATNPFNKAFDVAGAVTSMTLNDTQTWGSNYALAQNSAMSVNTADKYAYCSNYGSGSGYHGASLSTILNDATSSKNFDFTWKQKFVGNKSQFGCMSVMLFKNTNGTRQLIAGINFQKTTKDAKTNVLFKCGSNSKSWTGSKRVKCSKVGTTSITKEGQTVTFKTCGKTLTMQLESADIIVNEIAFYFGKNGSKTALGTNALYEASLTRFAYATYGDVENMFMPGDVLTIDTKDASVFLDSGDSTTPANNIGAIGNDWEQFVLHAGHNDIGIEYSDWTTATPEAVMKYRKVYL